MTQRLAFKDSNETCEFCGSVEYSVSATLIQCTRCGITYGRCEGVWRVDETTVPLLIRRKSFNSREMANEDPSKNDGLYDNTEND